MSAIALLATTLAPAWRIAFLAASAPVVGAVLLLAISRVTGARWQAFAPLAALAPWLMPGAALLGACETMVAKPPHLTLWLAWWAVLLRGLLATAGLAYASARLRAGAGETFAGVTLAIYALVVTPLASDWMLGQAPGHAVSAIGLMHLTQSIGAAAACALMMRLGSPSFRRDMAKLMIAAMLGLAYLAFMDVLIVWYGNLPSHVGFYLQRGTVGMAWPAWSGLAVGLVAPIMLLWQMRENGGQHLAGACVLTGMALFDGWWVSGGLLAMLGGMVVSAALLLSVSHLARREVEHG